MKASSTRPNLVPMPVFVVRGRKNGTMVRARTVQVPVEWSTSRVFIHPECRTSLIDLDAWKNGERNILKFSPVSADYMAVAAQLLSTGRAGIFRHDEMKMGSHRGKPFIRERSLFGQSHPFIALKDLARGPLFRLRTSDYAPGLPSFWDWAISSFGGLRGVPIEEINEKLASGSQVIVLTNAKPAPPYLPMVAISMLEADPLKSRFFPAGIYEKSVPREYLEAEFLGAEPIEKLFLVAFGGWSVRKLIFSQPFPKSCDA